MMVEMKLEKMKHELEKILDQIDKIKIKSDTEPLGFLESRKFKKLKEKTKKIEITLLQLKIEANKKQDEAFQQNLLTEKEIREYKIQTLLDNMQIFDITDDNGEEIKTRQQLEEKTTEWLTENANASDQELLKVTGEKDRTDQIDFKQEANSGKQ